MLNVKKCQSHISWKKAMNLSNGNVGLKLMCSTPTWSERKGTNGTTQEKWEKRINRERKKIRDVSNGSVEKKWVK